MRTAGSLLGTNEQERLVNALRLLDMTMADLAFEKDVGRPVFVLERNRRMLSDPLQLPALGASVLATIAGQDADSIWRLAAELLETEPIESEPPDAFEVEDAPWRATLPELDRFFADAKRAAACLDRAYANLTGNDRQYLAAAYLSGLFQAEDRPAARDILHRAGLSDVFVERAIRESLDMDPEPSAMAFLEALSRLDAAALLEAGRIFQGATARLASDVALLTNWPAKITRFQTELGAIVIGAPGDDAYSEAALLILDPGGNDTYRGAAGTANGLIGRRLSAIVDLAGDDRYHAEGALGAGAALFGVAVVLDLEGNDCYIASHMGQGAGLFGAGWIEDRAGDDVYRAGAFAQGAGYGGFGYLLDHGGNDLFDVGLCGQGYAGVRGVGMLVNRDGNDRYHAGGREPDHERNDERYLSLSQGFAIGMRPFAGGGVAALVDLAGNDTYVADVYGQGVSYWYSIGMLMDVSGHDTYTLHQYGQGAGIHLSAGLLADGGGNDVYTGGILVQGAAHDYAVGMLIERSGNDVYTADRHGQGRAINNSFALLVDSGGDDAYFARQPDQCQGIGNDGDKREYGSLALLLDLGGRDHYSSDAEDGARKTRPDFGIIYDVEDEE